jgi:hypothetical protein
MLEKYKDHLKVCDGCLRAIESREGKMDIETVITGENLVCDWCKDDYFEELHVIKKDK